MKITEVASTDILTELSTELLGRYKTAAGKEASAADKKGDYKTGDKRFSGIVKATKKQFDNDAKARIKEDDIDYDMDFADRLYNAFSEKYPTMCRRAGPHAVGNVIQGFLYLADKVEPEQLTGVVAKEVKELL